MARRLGARKRPSREKYVLKEQEKVDSGIFDTRTMVYLGKFYNKGIISKLNFVMARGKEADLYIAEAGESKMMHGAKFVAIKFFRVETSSFFKMADYIVGDPRFRGISRSRTDVISTWCKKEFGNLLVAREAGVDAPKPYMFNGSILAMEFIGDDSGTPAPALKDVKVENADAILDAILSHIRKLYRAGLVHADVSEFNVLMHEGRAYLIDFGQAVVTKHPKAEEFLERDVRNVLDYFRKTYGIKRSHAKELRKVRG